MKNKERFKGIITGFLICAMLSASFAILANSPIRNRSINVLYGHINLVVNGQSFTPRDAQNNVVEPFVYQGTTFLPARAISEALGYAVYWDGETSTVYIGQPPPPAPPAPPTPPAPPQAPRVNIADIVHTWDLSGIMPLLGNVVDSGYGMWEWFVFDTGLEIMGDKVFLDFRVAGSERFHFNGLDNTSTRADVRAMMGAPYESSDETWYFYILDHEVMSTGIRSVFFLTLPAEFYL